MAAKFPPKFSASHTMWHGAPFQLLPQMKIGNNALIYTAKQTCIKEFQVLM
jgi:hypothetical protein